MLKLNENLKIVKNYYIELDQYEKFGISHETSVREAFRKVLDYCCKQTNLQLVSEYSIENPFKKTKIIIDGAFLDHFNLTHGFWEAKDSQDDLDKEIKLKFQKGYPAINTIFQAPYHAVIFQNKIKVFDEPIDKPKNLVTALELLFNYKSEPIADWEQAVEQFKEKIPALAQSLLELIEKEMQNNHHFRQAYRSFADIIRLSINPNISESAIEEMLIQHLLTEQIFSSVFNNPDFVKKNIIARQIESVVDALTHKYFNKQEFFKPLNPFFASIKNVANNSDLLFDFASKQSFLNTVYEKFFQGFAVKQADTLGIVYTPQPVVNFMVDSVEQILRREFNRSLASPGVHILDPFVGTGNFILNIMRKIKKTELQYKYRHELHCNEVMLLPYYVATMNIEHTYYELIGEYEPFPGACLVDTFELAESRQLELGFSEENTQRIEQLKQTPIFVYISNPPYNAGQVNENDNNKNRKYPTIDRRIRETFSKDSKATLKAQLYDPYVRAFRFAMDKIIEQGEGIIAFISNNGYLDGIAFDGMRKHIYENFDKIYIFNLKGNVRKNPKISGTTHNVFGIQVGVCITFLIKKKEGGKSDKINYYEIDDFTLKEEKYRILENFGTIYNVPWREIVPDSNHTWLTEGLQEDFDSLVPLGERTLNTNERNLTFEIFIPGVNSGKDAWVYNSNKDNLINNIKKFILFYNYQVFKYQNSKIKPQNIDDFVDYDERQISWSSTLKSHLKRNEVADFNENEIKISIYRPFYKQFIYFNRIIVDRPSLFPKIFPTAESENENRVIAVTGLGWKSPFFAIMTNCIVDIQIAGNTQCFPFYVYEEDGSGRRENISDWALELFRNHYHDERITKWDIFYYIYAVLHKKDYRQRYQQNLRRSLPRIPLYEDFWKFAQAGRKLGDLHVNYEQAEEYPLEAIETRNEQLDYRVEKMVISKGKQSIKYNDFLTLAGVPLEVYNYRLGNRSALEWVVDQYRVKVDPRSGIVNDPNQADDPTYIIRLIKKIVTVSLETVKIVESL
ncbi:DNA helicase [Bacteroidetes/Chlorobi group bacterium Naka2016]|jgi:predicted helicase|nr:MAG: DNA helicase [Bacteroidetes/Chlorobi group bacterium Naka2016]